jgi:hypothetical protein
MKLDYAATHLEALGNPTPVKIYRALVRAGGGGSTRRPATEQIRASYDVMRGLVDFLVAECCADTSELFGIKFSISSFTGESQWNSQRQLPSYAHADEQGLMRRPSGQLPPSRP